MVNYAGDYGGSNAQASRQAAIARYPTGAAGSAALAPTVKKTAATKPAISSGPSGRYSAAPSAPPAAMPGAQDPNAWLGSDTGYQDQLRQLQLAMTNFGADVGRRQGEINTDYNTSNRAMGKQKDLDLKSMESDWAGRGMIRSGLYGDAVGNYNEEFNQRLAELLSGRDRALSQLTQEQQAFQTQQELDQQAAREAALRRRAQGLGTV
jgi:hypothetical protein